MPDLNRKEKSSFSEDSGKSGGSGKSTSSGGSEDSTDSGSSVFSKPTVRSESPNESPQHSPERPTKPIHDEKTTEQAPSAIEEIAKSNIEECTKPAAEQAPVEENTGLKDVEMKEDAKPLQDEKEPEINPANPATYRPQFANRNFNDSLLPDSSDPKLIRRQVEFYFGDSNLTTDTYMRGLIRNSEPDGVKVSEIHKFKRMQRFKYSLIVPALKGSSIVKTSGLEGEETIQRIIPYDDLTAIKDKEARATREKEQLERSLFVKGFGEEDATTQYEIEKFFDEYGPHKQVRLRRDPLGLFKGSVFVEFETADRARAFMNLDLKPKYRDTMALEAMTKEEHIRRNTEDIKAGRKLGSLNHLGRKRKRKELGLPSQRNVDWAQSNHTNINRHRNRKQAGAESKEYNWRLLHTAAMIVEDARVSDFDGKTPGRKQRKQEKLARWKATKGPRDEDDTEGQAKKEQLTEEL